MSGVTCQRGGVQPPLPAFVRFPLKHREKTPAVRFKSRDRFEIPDGCENTGIRLDRMIVLDVDKGRLPEGVTVEGAVNTLRQMGVPVDDCPRVRTGSGGEHIYLALPEAPPKLVARLLPYVDVKAGRGAYVVAPGSVHPNGERYERLNTIELRDAPLASPSLLRSVTRPQADGASDASPGLLEPKHLKAVLQGLDVEAFQDHDRWLELMMACRHACPEGEYEFVEWSTGDPSYAHLADEIAYRWRSVDPFVEGGVTIATLVQRLIEAKEERSDDLAPRRALAVIDFAGVEEEESERGDGSGDSTPDIDRFPLYTADDLLALSPPDWLLERALPCGSLGVLYGPPKSAKTFLALEIALSMASGQPDVHGLPCRPGRVLYVLAEGGAPMMRDRVWAWLNHRGVRVDEEFAVYPYSVLLSDPRAVDRLLTGAGESWDLVVFDTLARCMEGDENSVKDMNAAIRGCDEVRERTGAAVLLVHHSGKDQTKGMRGSTALLGAVDSVLRMRPEGNRFLFQVEELRHGEPADGRQVALQPSGDSAVLIGSGQVDFSPRATVLELALKLADGAPRKELQTAVIDELNVSAPTAKRYISEYIGLGRPEATKAPDGQAVWREPDETRGPKAEVIRHS